MSDPRCIVVTGASSGIGRAVSIALLEAGYRVVGVSRRAAQGMPQYPGYSGASLDLADLERLPERFEALLRSHEPVAGAVLCAGAGRFGSLEEFSYQQIRALIELNLISTVYCTRALIPRLKRRGGGDVILVGSEAALAGRRRGTIYCASKFALRGFAQALREECASSGLRVTLINPGMVDTDFYAALDFAPGSDPSNTVHVDDIARAVLLVLGSHPGTVFDEINLSPLRRVIRSTRSQR